MSLRTKRILQGALGFLFGAVFLYLAVGELKAEELWNALRSAHLWYLGPILLLYVAYFWLKAIRWSWLVRPVKPLSTRQVFPALMIGFMGNNVLPAHLGEFVRMYALAKQYDLSKTAVLSTIVLERVFDFLGIILLFAVSLQFVPVSGDLEAVRIFGYVMGAASLAVFLLFLLYVWKTDACLRVAETVLVIAPRGLRARMLATMRLAGAGLYSLRNPYLLFGTIALTLIHWVANGFSHYFVVISFPLEESLSPVAGLFLLSVMALGITLPAPPGYVGTTQFCYKLALAAFAIPAATAVSASFYALAVGYIPVTLVGLFFMWRLGLKFRTISREAELPP